MQRHIGAPDADGDEIDALGPWFHNLHLPDGRRTAPDHPYGDFPAFKWRDLAAYIPEDLTGWMALDIGCNAGFYSFELARRGANVTGLDREDLYLRQARWAAQRFGLERKVRFEKGQIHDLARERRRFDLVLFMGLFYHLRYPLLALDTVARMRPRLLVVQTLSIPAAPGTETVVLPPREDLDFATIDRIAAPDWPRLAFVEGRFSGDETNWFVPDGAAMAALLRSAGFHILKRPNAETFICEHAGATQPDWCAEEWRAATGVAEGVTP